MNARWQQGLSDAATTLQAAPWLAPKVSEVGVRVFDVMHDILLDQNPATPAAGPADDDRPAMQAIGRPPSGDPKTRKSV